MKIWIKKLFLLCLALVLLAIPAALLKRKETVK